MDHSIPHRDSPHRLSSVVHHHPHLSSFVIICHRSSVICCCCFPYVRRSNKNKGDYKTRGKMLVIKTNLSEDAFDNIKFITTYYNFVPS